MFRRKKINKEDKEKMCLYPKMIKNPKYLPNKKNNNNPPEITDYRYRDWELYGMQKAEKARMANQNERRNQTRQNR